MQALTPLVLSKYIKIATIGVRFKIENLNANKQTKSTKWIKMNKMLGYHSDSTKEILSFFLF